MDFLKRKSEHFSIFDFLFYHFSYTPSARFFCTNFCLRRFPFSFSTKELFLKFLQRLEADYNPKEYEGNLVKDVSNTIFIFSRYLTIIRRSGSEY